MLLTLSIVILWFYKKKHALDQIIYGTRLNVSYEERMMMMHVNLDIDDNKNYSK